MLILAIGLDLLMKKTHQLYSSPIGFLSVTSQKNLFLSSFTFDNIT